MIRRRRFWTTTLVAAIAAVATFATFATAGRAGGVVDRYDHATTGFTLDGRHQEVPCQSCHRGGVFAGTTRRCAQCHNNIVAEGKTFLHIPVTSACDTCHSTRDWLTSRFDHSGVYVACVRCHNNFLAPGKTARHPQTDNVCEQCHISVHWNQLLPGARSRQLGWRPLPWNRTQKAGR